MDAAGPVAAAAPPRPRAQLAAPTGAPAAPAPADAAAPAARAAPAAQAAAAAPRRLLFVIDASDAMRDSFGLVRSELNKAVANMPAGATFNVLLSAGGQVTAFKPQPVPPTPEAAAELARFLGRATPSGTSELLPAVEHALRQQRADTLWLVTDGDVRDGEQFLARLRAADPDGRTKIHTIVAGDTTQAVSPATARFVEFLATIASAHGGQCIDLTGNRVDVGALKITSQPGSDAPPATAPTPKSDSPSKLFDEL
jgi:hypothetical protein